MTEIQKLTNNKEIIAYLAEKFPLCFSLEGEAKPLKIGLFQDLAEALANDEKVSKTQLRQALRQYTSNWRYLHGCRAGAVRVDLNGEPAGILEQEHVEHAAAKLAEAKAKVAERRAVEKANKKRSVHRSANKSENKKSAGKKFSKPRQVEQIFVNVDLANLQKGDVVRVKAGDKTTKAEILEVVKEGARVELENGLILTVSADRLFA
ncbi:RNA chaperone ProQ [Histophilus somni]|uniref:RNA chaperone ProQ n=1 Tax=Histophilus somni TaxID=731 RepID=A0A9Q7E8T4_HISSO|nr:RNA chaperone ProQ [Histophilus somni]ARU64707.1 RNA chaperone ProQ [Histophilus somni]ARU66572.1 RNA chaperone ProQ [Histophilus somni]ARU68446.1 RNA chaperone ProQ [Histophilus somni]ARU70325.1 RNA chaperone ProQ [Histophilus somni]ARU72200.1 RNA chaperone ProQ [Histophilus somni]